MKLENVAIDSLKPHPRNYQGHPDDQLAHLEESIREHDVYRNVVIARDGTILAGHGVVLAASRLGKTKIPVHRLPLDPDDPRALKVLTGDNEIRNRADRDETALAELLQSIKNSDAGLIGTGFDDSGLEGLIKRLGDDVLGPEADGKEYDESVADEVEYHECPECHHKWPK